MAGDKKLMADLWRRIRNWASPLTQREEREEDLERELRSHLDLEAEEQRDGGLAGEEARYAAHRAFGSTDAVKEEIRDMWGWTSIERLRQDVRYGIR
jgi:sigma54-dependent transcription regulator